MKKTARGILHVVKNAIKSFYKNNSINIAQNQANGKSFAFVADPRTVSKYNRLYLEVTLPAKITRKITFNREATVKRLVKQTGMVVLKQDAGLSNVDALLVPDFIDMSIKLPADVTAYKKMLPYTARYDIHKIELAGFTWAVVKDAGWISTFYNSYYRPSMQQRHGDEAYIMSENKMRTLMNNGDFEFLTIFDDDVCVATVLAEIQPDRYHYYKLGWLNGNDRLIKTGATAAMYWFVITRAFALNKTEVVLGGTPAYLENGVLKYKAKWLATLNRNCFTVNQLFLKPDVPGCYSFLQRTSIIALNKNNELIVLSSKTTDTVGVTGVVLNDITAWYLLLDTQQDHFDIDTEDLPLSLRYWYKRMPEISR